MQKISELVKSQFRTMHVSPTLAMNQLSKKLLKEGKQIIKFGFGQSPFPVPQSIVKELQKNAFQKDYLPVGGLPTLNNAICDFYKKKPEYNNYKFSAEGVIVGPGSKQLMFWLQLIFNGDIVIPVPSWVSYCPQSLLCRNKLHMIPTQFKNNWQITAQDIRRISPNMQNRNKMIILNSPNNPTGTHPVNTQSLAQQLKKNNYIVMSDQIYSQLSFKEMPTIANYYPQQTIISTGLSKWCGAGGWRLGFHIYPPQLKELLDMIKIVGSQTFSSVSAPVQYAAIKAYTQDHTNYLNNSVKILKAAAYYVYERLRAQKVKICKPTGGFYVMPDMTQLLSHKFNNSRQMCHNLLTQKGVAVLPGVDFGFEQKNLTFRISFVDFDGEQFLNYLQKNPNNEIDEKVLIKMAPNIIKGTQKIVEWIRQSKK